MKVVTKTTAMMMPTMHRFVAGLGYHFLGDLPLPDEIQNPREYCEPPKSVIDDSWHNLRPPGGGAPVKMQWRGFELGEWMPPLGRGIRMSFTSTYLAAHGWEYQGPYRDEHS